MRRPVLAPTAVAVLALGLLAPAHQQAAADVATSPTACAGLAGLQIPARAIGLPTSGGEVTAALPVAGTGGAYCQVDASLRPVDPAAPEIRMRVALPERWNRGAVMLGGGGYNGTIPPVTGNVPFPATGAAAPLDRGYAVFASDSGHQADPAKKPSASLDGSFGVNDEAVRNFSGDALKKTRDAALFVLERRYGSRPSTSYFAGGSTGGREALAVAQRWPRDFDGVISAYPAWNAASLDLYFGHIAQVMSRPGAFPGPAQQALLEESVLRACDGRDGVRDGVISDEAGCRFDPAVLRCPRGVEPGPTCLSERQVAALRAVSSPLRWPYRVASGERGYPGFPFLSGARFSTPVLGMGSTAPANPMPVTSGYGVQFWEQWVKYFVTRDAGYDSLSLDPLRPGRWRERISDLTALQDVNDTDLRPFARAGGKLLVVHGAADELVSHRSTNEYWERMRRGTGPRTVDRFARYYVVPGANHANIGARFAAGWDSLSALERWTRDGRAPRDPVVTDTNPTAAGRARPLCEYPTWPRYRGGDPAVASSFACVGSRR